MRIVFYNFEGNDRKSKSVRLRGARIVKVTVQMRVPRWTDSRKGKKSVVL